MTLLHIVPDSCRHSSESGNPGTLVFKAPKHWITAVAGMTGQ